MKNDIIQNNEHFLQNHANDLQANIFTPHRKDHVWLLFLNFGTGGNEEKREVMDTLSLMGNPDNPNRITSSQEMTDPRSTTWEQIFINLYLSSNGLKYLGAQDNGWEKIIDALELPAHKKDLSEEQEFSVDALLLLAHSKVAELTRVRNNIIGRLKRSGVTLARTEVGRVYRKKLLPNQKRGFSVEHFGYADGLTNPWVKEADTKINDQPRSRTAWDTTTSAHEFIQLEPLISGKESYGSFLVFRKFKQNVKRFQDKMNDLAQQTGFTADEMGALMIGRTRSGTPIELDGNGNVSLLDYNNFTYKNNKCPFFAHIRKANPRTNPNEPNNAILRRGLTYGNRKTKLVGGIYEVDWEVELSEEVGLLFMSFQNDFKTFQNILDRSFDSTNGIDPILGKLNDSNSHELNRKDGGTLTYKGLGEFATLKGGVNLYAPSIRFFREFLSLNHHI